MVPSSGGPGSRPRQQQYENRSGSNPIGENSSSTERWEDVPRGTMDEVSSYVRLVLPSTDGKAARKIVPPRLRIPYWKGLGADSEEKHEPVSDIDTVVVDSLKALDPKRPIREADSSRTSRHGRFVPGTDIRRSGNAAQGRLPVSSLWRGRVVPALRLGPKGPPGF